MTYSVRRAVLALALVASPFAASSVADAQTATPVASFMTVDSYGFGSTNPTLMEVTGAIQTATGTQTGPRYLQFSSSTDPSGLVCERAMIQSVNRPGRFRIDVYGVPTGTAPNIIINSPKCTLARLP